MRTVLGLVLLVAFAAGCGRPAGSESQGCSEFGVPPGISLTVPAAVTGISRATLEACWAGRCVSRQVDLLPATTAGGTTCSSTGPDGVCSARMVPSGDLTGFTEVPGLPAAPVQVTLTFDDGKRHSVPITPTAVSMGAAQCGTGGPQAKLVVGPDHEIKPS